MALGIINLVFETIGMISIFAVRRYNIKDMILTGNMTKVPQAKDIFKGLNEMFKINFIIPEMSQYGPVVGAALCHYSEITT
jgi:type II pantothenate kinase